MKEKFNRKHKIIKRLIAIGVILVLVFAAYIFVLQPIVGNPFVSNKTLHDASFFVPDVYEDLEKGSLFAEMFYGYDFSDQCNVIDFYYTDNKTKDSFVYGKRPDIYAITLDAGEYYDEIIAHIQSNGTFIGKDGVAEEGTSYYLMPSLGVVSDRFVFRFGNSVEALQFILVTEIDEKDVSQSGGVWNIMPTIFYWSGMELDAHMP